MAEKIFDPEMMGKIVDALKNVFDPELPVNIYDMGLIYDISLEEGGFVRILMTLTNPNCPVADKLVRDVRKNLIAINGIDEAEVELTFTPPWTPDRMSDEARLDMGMF